MKKIVLNLILAFGIIILGSTSYSQTQYNPNTCTNNGSYASALGDYCNANYSKGIAFGHNSDANEDYATSIGINNSANGECSVALGDYNYANGLRSFACNYRNSANGACSFVCGHRNIAAGDYSFSLGQFSKGLSNSVFEIGWGTSTSDRKNLLTVRNNGSVIIGSTDLVYGLFQINTNTADESHGFTLFANAGTTARSYLRSDGASDFNWFLTRSGLDNKGIVINKDGAVGIGTSTIPAEYKLAVDGGIISEAILVELSPYWPDFIFNADYTLMSLSDLDNYIKINKHLPGVPTSDSINSKGINLGEMDAILLSKIEELTLYIIQLKKENDELNKKIETIQQ